MFLLNCILQFTSHLTCRSEVHVDVSSTIRGVDAADVEPRVGFPHILQQQGGISCRQRFREQLSSPLEIWVLVPKIRKAVLKLVNKSTCPCLFPGDGDAGDCFRIIVSVKKAAEKLFLSDVSNRKHVAALDFSDEFCGARRISH